MLINLYTYIVVFTSSQFYKKFLDNLKAKVKIEEITEEDIKGNLTFWEEKEEADKLFPNK